MTYEGEPVYPGPDDYTKSGYHYDAGADGPPYKRDLRQSPIKVEVFHMDF